MTLNILKLRKSSERFKSKREWLNSMHSFSFAEHKDTFWDNFGKIRVINEDVISPNNGFNMHSHSNMEIITIVLKGSITHRDSLNNLGIIHKDEVQVMSAGSGISHSERNEGNQDCKLFQIWIYPNQQNLKPSYNQNSMNYIFGNNMIINSSNEDYNNLFINQDISIWRCKYKVSNINYLPTEINKFNWIQIINGNLLLKDKDKKTSVNLCSGDGLGFETSNFKEIYIKAESEVDFLLFSMPNL